MAHGVQEGQVRRGVVVPASEAISVDSLSVRAFQWKGNKPVPPGLHGGAGAVGRWRWQVPCSSSHHWCTQYNPTSSPPAPRRSLSSSAAHTCTSSLATPAAWAQEVGGAHVGGEGEEEGGGVAPPGHGQQVLLKVLEVGFGAGVLPQPGLLHAPMPAASLALPPRVSSLTLAASSR